MRDQCRQHGGATQKWNQVDLFVLKAFAPSHKPLPIIGCITETFDFLRRVMHWQVFERESRKTPNH